MRKNAIDIVTMGCSKNLVDSERLMAMLEQQGYHVEHDPEESRAEIAVVNTCGFIGDAKEESINMILQFCQRKQEGSLRRLYVMGCLSQRYLKELGKELPEVDKFFGKFDWTGLVEELNISTKYKVQSTTEKKSNNSSTRQLVNSSTCQRHLTTPHHYAYLKISEGCDRHCAYCAIPIITGRHQSRPMEDIITEVEWLVGQGVREFQVIAQELTYYGIDLYGEQKIAELVERMADVRGVKWIRLHYAYPTNFPWALLDVMRRKKNVCRYLDIALQHINTTVLQNMRRHITSDETYAFIERLRREVPGIHLRTTLMVGFPGEDDAAFDELLAFVRWARFERMGAFAYCEEDGTWAAKHLKDEIPDEVKQERLSRLMRLQQKISAEVQAAKVGQTLRVVIDRREGDYYVGRTEFDSPEVDPEVLIPISQGTLRRGCFYDIRITEADEFDLYGMKNPQ
jgi:ribosomal protein S12 methylthiotransferase